MAWKKKLYLCSIDYKLGFSGGASSKEPACQYRRCKRSRFDPWVGKIPWKKKWQPTLVFLSGESHGQRSLAGYSAWGCKESDTTEWLNTYAHSTSINCLIHHLINQWNKENGERCVRQRQPQDQNHRGCEHLVGESEGLLSTLLLLFPLI